MSVEQIKAWNELAQTVGVPAFIIVVIGLITAYIATRVIWPWVIKRIEVNDTENAKRHQGYLDAQRANIDESKATTQVLMLMRESIDKHEVQESRRGDDLRELLNRRFDELLRAIQETNRR
jgi:predicted exporter